jgi:hypothetical protein
MEKTRKVIVDTYRQILDKLMSASIEVDRAADPGMGSVEKKDIRTQIMRMQADFRTAEYAVPDTDEWNVCRVVFFGETNAGKSTLIEALRLYYAARRQTAWGKWGATIGDGNTDFTQQPVYYDVRVGSCTLRLTDLPGIEGVLEGKSPDFSKSIEDELSKANVVLYIVGNEKKPERETLKKLKSYLRQDARVYAVCNVHCKGKKNRDPALDGLYTDDLMKKMEAVRREAAVQAAEELRAVLGENYQGGYAMNAHLAFAGVAYDETSGKTLIAPHLDALIQDQGIYAREFDGSYQGMRAASRLDMIVELLQEWARDFPTACYEQQRRKLSRLIGELTVRDGARLGALAMLSELHVQMEREYRVFESACAEASTAQSVFARRIAEIPQKVATKYRTKYQNEMYRAIEKDWDGSISEKRVKQFMKDHEQGMQTFIAEEAQKKIDEAVSVLRGEYERLSMEINRVEQMGFGQSAGIRFSGSGFRDKGFDLGDTLWKGVEVGLGGLAMRAAIGGGLGFLPGMAIVLAFEAIKYFMGADERLAKAKAAAKELFAEQERKITYKLIKKMNELDLIGKVRSETYEKFSQAVDQHAAAAREIGTVVKDLRHFFRAE